jgi:hypothetical protein
MSAMGSLDFNTRPDVDFQDEFLNAAFSAEKECTDNGKELLRA